MRSHTGWMPLVANGTPNNCVLSAAVGTATVTRTFPFSWETVRARNGTSLIGLGWNEPQADISIATSSMTRPNAPRRFSGQPQSSWDLVPIGIHPHLSAIGRDALIGFQGLRLQSC